MKPCLHQVQGITLLLFLVFTGCSHRIQSSAKPSGNAVLLIGEWNNLSIKIDIQSKNNTSANEVFEVNRPDWESTLKIKPIRTFFRADSTWNSAHYNLKDSLVYDPSGKWWLMGNTLIMAQQLPTRDTNIYQLTITKDTATFICLLDWDQDGKKDDNYVGRQVKVARLP